MAHPLWCVRCPPACMCSVGVSVRVRGSRAASLALPLDCTQSNTQAKQWRAGAQQRGGNTTDAVDGRVLRYCAQDVSSRAASGVPPLRPCFRFHAISHEDFKMGSPNSAKLRATYGLI
jgi:hypothetical protein